MPKFIKTCSFTTTSTFKHQKDDKELNKTIQAIEKNGAVITDIQVLFAGRSTDAIVFYAIFYNRDKPID